jgi:hypothetical protein
VEEPGELYLYPGERQIRQEAVDPRRRGIPCEGKALSIDGTLPVTPSQGPAESPGSVSSSAALTSTETSTGRVEIR